MPRTSEPRSHVRPKKPAAGADIRSGTPGAGPHHARRRRTHRWARGIGLTLTAALTFTGTFASAMYVQSQANINTIDIDDLIASPHAPEALKDPNDPYAGKELNILVMGTDYRDEANIAIAGEDDGGMRSDTTFLVHVSGDRSFVEVISFPRDALVSVPGCKQPDGGTSKPMKSVMFNSAFETGADGEEDENTALAHAAACTYNTVQQLTGIQPTNFVVLKMTGVIGIVDALGGVTMCFDEPVIGNKKYSPDLNLPAGQVTLDGRTSIAFVRARKGTGLGLEQGSDLTRIQRQQAFIDSTLSQILTGDILSDSRRLYLVLQELLKSMTVDSEFGNLTADVGLAFSLRNLDPSRIVFTELPVATAPSDPNRVVFTAAAKEIWARIAAGDPPPSIAPPVEETPGAGTGEGSQAPTPAPEPDPGVQPSEPGTDTGPAPSAPDPGTVAPPTPATPERLPGVCYPGWVPPSG